MQKLDPKTDGASPDFVEKNIETLCELFPDAFTEGTDPDGPRRKIDFDALRELLGDQIEQRDERYGLTWHGKAQARRLAQTPSTGTLRPSPEESVNWDSTENLFIEGDNLEVLKLLQKSYHKQVKMIYIDPPYNTGKDFVYRDDYRDNIRNYLELTGQTIGGAKISANVEGSGRFHTNWLNMLYPRLRLARGLLRDDGVILISIDDTEFHNLRFAMDEIFGEENLLAVLVWDRNRKNDAKYFSVGHEYMLVYAKNESYLSANQVVFRGAKEGVEEVRELFERLKNDGSYDWNAIRERVLRFYDTIPDDDPRAPIKRFTKVDEKGPYRDDGNINWPGGNGPRYEVVHPKTNRPCKIPRSGWRYPTPERLWEEVEKKRVVFGPDESTVPRIRTNLFENADQVLGSVHYSYAQTAANEFNEIFDGERVFDNPKPKSDLQRLTGYLTDQEDIILDFFAGSGTLGHAVMAQNADDGGNRRYILVQLQEELDPNNREQQAACRLCDRLNVPRNIAEIAKERLRRAGRRTVDQSGFKVFTLDSSNILPWDPDYENLEASLLSAVENLRLGRTEWDVVYELLLKYGLDLSVPVEEHEIAGCSVYVVGAGALITCLADRIDLEVVQGIAALKAELAPEVVRVVFKDAGFADDVVKTNTIQILQQAGIEDVRSL